MNTDREFDRVSCFKYTRLKENNKEVETVYLPQIEIVKYNAASGTIISRDFVCISSNGEIVEFDNEMDALSYAIEFRSKQMSVSDARSQVYDRKLERE